MLPPPEKTLPSKSCAPRGIYFAFSNLLFLLHCNTLSNTSLPQSPLGLYLFQTAEKIYNSLFSLIGNTKNCINIHVIDLSHPIHPRYSSRWYDFSYEKSRSKLTPRSGHCNHSSKSRYPHLRSWLDIYIFDPPLKRRKGVIRSNHHNRSRQDPQAPL